MEYVVKTILNILYILWTILQHNLMVYLKKVFNNKHYSKSIIIKSCYIKVFGIDGWGGGENFTDLWIKLIK